MFDYKSYEVKDFISNESFQRWVLQDASEDKIFWEDWLIRNPEKLELVDKAQRMLLNIRGAFDNISNVEISQEISRLADTLQDKQSIIPIYQRTWFRMAASIVIALGIGFILYVNNADQKLESGMSISLPASTVAMVEKANTTENALLVTLPDGSSILLHKRTRITYPEKFADDKREVHLYGEAFFEVAKNPSKPFIVYANDLVAKVLGTSFTIRAYEKDDQVKVIVKTGKVKVYARKDIDNDKNVVGKTEKSLLLTPNQQVVFNREVSQMTCSAVTLPDIQEFVIQRQPFEFKRSSMSEVFSTLEKSYGVKITSDSLTMKNCYLTASLADEPLLEKLDLICRTIDGHYERIDSLFIIRSNGCKK